MKLIYESIPITSKCKLCEKIDTKLRKRQNEAERLARWRTEGSKYSAGIDRALDVVKSLEKEINDLGYERQRRLHAIGGSAHDESIGENAPVSRSELLEQLRVYEVIRSKSQSYGPHLGANAVEQELQQIRAVVDDFIQSGPLSRNRLLAVRDSQSSTIPSRATSTRHTEPTGSIFSAAFSATSDVSDDSLHYAVNTTDFEECTLLQRNHESTNTREQSEQNEEPGGEDRCSPWGLEPDFRLVDPAQHFRNLASLENFVFLQSAVKAIYVDAPNQARPEDWNYESFTWDSTERNVQTVLPKFEKHGWSDRTIKDIKRMSKSLLYLFACRNLINSALMSLEYLRYQGFCEGSLCVFVMDTRPQVVNLVTISRTELEGLAQTFQAALLSVTEEDATLTPQNIYEWDERLVDLHENCHAILRSLGLLKDGSHESSANIYDLRREELWLPTVQAVDLAILSFAGSHISPFDERLFDVAEHTFDIPLERIGMPIPSPSLESTSKMTKKLMQPFFLGRRYLDCMNGLTRGKPIWVFHLHIDHLPSDRDKRLQLSTNVHTLAGLWGPLWAISMRGDPQKILEYRIGNGRILPWPSGEQQDLKSDEIFCHWIPCGRDSTTDPDAMDVSSDDDPAYFNGTETLLTGADTTYLSSNMLCSCDEGQAKRRYRNMNRLHQPGTIKHSRTLDTQVFQIQGGSMGISGAFQLEYKMNNGQTWKEALVERWELQPTRRNPRALEHWFGVEISVCTENARRRRLTQILGTATILDYLAANGFQWISENQRVMYIDAVQSENPSAFRVLYHKTPEWQDKLGSAVSASLLALKETGVEENGTLRALWMTEPDDEWIVRFRKEDHSWISMMKDSTEAATMSVLSSKCLDFDKTLLRRCSGCNKSSVDGLRYREYPPVFETAITINELVSPEKLRKVRSVREASGSESLYQWDLSTIKENFSFPIGDEEGKRGDLVVVRSMPYSGLLIMQWKNTVPQVRSLKRLVRENMLGKEVGKYHEEYIRDGKWEKIVIHVVSREGGAFGSSWFGKPM